MISTLGKALILASVVAATAGAFGGIAAGRSGSASARRWTWRLAYLFAFLMLAANALMEYALIAKDFSISYAAQVGSRGVPGWVAAVSLWSSLDGSILFWGAILGLFIALVAWFNRDNPAPSLPYAIGTMMAVGVFFAFLIAGPADPFKPVFPAPPDGPGPNPLLQNHLLMVIHPPMLYAGYVGMVAPFGLAVGGLLAGSLGRDLLKPLRTWLLVTWGFLTVGIVLGGWWAYEVLGWGGYWAWDPVENASLLPWLTATAALHSLLLVERRGILKGWTLTLILATFLLTILGTFMTRSGVFNSVHSFSQSDIGPTFLTFLAMALLFSIGLLSARIGVMKADADLHGGSSRESAFLVNNLLLVTLTLTVLLGTVFPLVVEAVRGTRISVGEPYFNRMAVPLGVALTFLMGIGPALPWGTAGLRELGRAAISGIPGALVFAAVGLVNGSRNAWLLVALAAGGFAVQVTLQQALAPAFARWRAGGENPFKALASQLSQGSRRMGSYVIHLGVLIILVAVAASSTLRQSSEKTLRQGESGTVGPYQFTFLGTSAVDEVNRRVEMVRFALSKDGVVFAEANPKMNHYFAMREPVGTPEVYSLPSGDIYLSVMSVDQESGVVGLRAFWNPMVSWIWGGAGIAVLGAMLALWPSRRRSAALAAEAKSAAAPAIAAGEAAP